MANKKYLIGFVLALAVIVLFALRPKDETNPAVINELESNWGQNPGQASTTVEVGATGDYTYGAVTSTESLPPPPQYRRNFTFPAYFNAEAKAITQKTIAGLQASIDKDRTNLKAWVELGNQYYLVRDFDGARLMWQYALVINSGHYLALANLGTLYMSDIKNYTLAEGYLRKAITADPTQIAAYRSLYELYRYGLKSDIKARAVLDEGISRNPGKATDLEYLRDHYSEQ